MLLVCIPVLIVHVFLVFLVLVLDFDLLLVLGLVFWILLPGLDCFHGFDPCLLYFDVSLFPCGFSHY